MNRRNLSRKFSRLILAFGLVAGIFAVSAKTASAQGITVTTPFTFSVGNQQYPAGTYQFTLTHDWMLSIRNIGAGGERFFSVRPEKKGSIGSNGQLVFSNSEGRRALQTVYIPGTDRTVELTARESVSPGKAKIHIATNASGSSAGTVAVTAQNTIVR